MVNCCSTFFQQQWDMVFLITVMLGSMRVNNHALIYIYIVLACMLSLMLEKIGMVSTGGRAIKAKVNTHGALWCWTFMKDDQYSLFYLFFSMINETDWNIIEKAIRKLISSKIIKFNMFKIIPPKKKSFNRRTFLMWINISTRMVQYTWGNYCNLEGAFLWKALELRHYRSAIKDALSIEDGPPFLYVRVRWRSVSLSKWLETCRYFMVKSKT